MVDILNKFVLFKDKLLSKLIIIWVILKYCDVKRIYR